jgi:hypothetical protein
VSISSWHPDRGVIIHIIHTFDAKILLQFLSSLKVGETFECSVGCTVDSFNISSYGRHAYDEDNSSWYHKGKVSLCSLRSLLH